MAVPFATLFCLVVSLICCFMILSFFVTLPIHLSILILFTYSCPSCRPGFCGKCCPIQRQLSQKVCRLANVCQAHLPLPVIIAPISMLNMSPRYQKLSTLSYFSPSNSVPHSASTTYGVPLSTSCIRHTNVVLADVNYCLHISTNFTSSYTGLQKHSSTISTDHHFHILGINLRSTIFLLRSSLVIPNRTRSSTWCTSVQKLNTS